MLRRWLPLTICLLFLIIVGCSNLRVSELSSIRIECADICNREDSQGEPITEKTFTEPEEISAFVNAVNQASRIKGELDYGVTFRMYAVYKNGGEKAYSLNISDSKQEGTRGLLVDSNDSGKGYSIPYKNHEELRKLIYYREDATYSETKENEGVTIRLQCADLCKGGQKPEGLFSEKTFTDPDETSVFVNAINKASKMNGMLNYTTNFLMYVSYPEPEAAEKVYVLNIANVKNEETRGLLVDTMDSKQGYEIQPEFHEELRKLIYGE